MPSPLLCFLGLMHGEASGGRWAPTLRCVTHSMQGPLPGTSLGEGCRSSAHPGQDPIPKDSTHSGHSPGRSPFFLELPGPPGSALGHVVTCVCLPSLQWNFIQAGAAKALGQALQLNTSLTSLE